MKRDTLKSIAAGLLLLCVPFAAVAFDSSALPGPGPAPAFTAVGGTVTQPVVLTGDNSGGTGTLRIRPSDEDTQLVLCEASNNAATEVCSSWQHYNSSSTASASFFATNLYLDSASASHTYANGMGTGYFQTAASTTAGGIYMGVRHPLSADNSVNYTFRCQSTGATTATCYTGDGHTVTSDFRGPITNGGSATCGGLWAGSVCIADDLVLQYSSGDVVFRGYSTSASGLVYYQFLNSAAGAAGSFGYGNASYADADFAGHSWYLTNNATTPLRMGNTANATATQPIVKVTDDTAASGTVEGQNHLVVYGAGTVAFPSTQTITCADNGGGTNATQNLDPQAHTITILNNDATGCDVTMQETSAILGAVAVICVDPASTATNVNLADVANVFNGAAPALGQGDCITIRYFDAANDLWLQTGASNN